MGECCQRLKRPQRAGRKEGFRGEEAFDLTLKDGKLYIMGWQRLLGMNPGVLYH